MTSVTRKLLLSFTVLLLTTALTACGKEVEVEACKNERSTLQCDTCCFEQGYEGSSYSSNGTCMCLEFD